MLRPTAVAMAVALLACAGGGALAGLDAAAHVDRRYLAPRIGQGRLPSMPASSPWDWNEVPPPAALPATYEVPSRSERAFFDTGYDLSDIDAAVERIEPVRVHRPAARAAEASAPTFADEASAADLPAPALSEATDGSPPADDMDASPPA